MCAGDRERSDNLFGTVRESVAGPLLLYNYMLNEFLHECVVVFFCILCEKDVKIKKKKYFIQDFLCVCVRVRVCVCVCDRDRDLTYSTTVDICLIIDSSSYLQSQNVAASFLLCVCVCVCV